MEQLCSRKSFILAGVPLCSLSTLLLLLFMASASVPAPVAAFAAPNQSTGPAVAITHTVGFDPATCPTARQLAVSAGTDLYFCLLMKNIGDVQFTTFTMTRVLAFPTETTNENYRFTFELDPGETISFTNESLFTRFKIEDSFELIELAAGADIDLQMTANTASASVTATSSAKVDVVDIALKRGVGATEQDCHEKNKITVVSEIPVYHCYEVTNSGNLTITIDRIEDALLNPTPNLNLQIGPNETITHGALTGSIGALVTMPTANSIYTATVYAAGAGIAVSSTSISEIDVLTKMLYMPVLRTPSAFVEKRALWEAQNLTSYEMIQRVSCFCPPPFNGQLMVVDGQIISGVDLDSRAPLSAIELDRFRSVDQLFDIIDGAEALPAESLSTTFHPDLGYPTSIGIDYVFEIADDEIGYQITFLEPRP